MINAFLMMGQSNMSGRGALNDLPEINNPHVFALRDEGWEVAKEPVVQDKSIAGAGMGTAFGAYINALTGADVGLIPCSMGGSALDEWQPGRELFEKAVAKSEVAIKSGARIVGILWHQGEHDSEHAHLAYTYMQRFEHMRDEFERRLRQIANEMGKPELVVSPLPVIAGELGEYLDEFPTSKYHDEVNRQLHMASAKAPQYACVSARGLEDRGDKLHFSAKAQRMLGLRYACAWAEVAANIGLEL